MGQHIFNASPPHPTGNKMQPFKITRWQKNVTANGCNLRSINELSTICKRNGDHLFSLLSVDVAAPEGYRLPHIVFIRGNAVVVVPLLRNRETGEERFLMVRQRRIGSGALTLEFPAGMIDHDDENPVDVGVKELFEETGIRVGREQLYPLCDKPLYSSAGASDEAIYYFGCRIEIPGVQFTSLHHGEHGDPEDNEHIILELHTRDEAEPLITSIQARLGFYLFGCTFCNK
jgi:8-oxo-dGTP pyrophosphatase MutT (NUDIX family)